MNLERTDLAQQNFDRVFGGYEPLLPSTRCAKGHVGCTSEHFTFEFADPERPDAVPAAFHNGITARANGVQEGRMIGEAERVALATANSELRSIILEVKRRLLAGEPNYCILSAIRAADTAAGVL